MAYTTIKKPSSYFNTKLYTGNGSTQSITGVGFQPDWVWYKGRNDTEDPKMFDAVRGVTKTIKPNGTDAEFTQSGVTSFDSDGFTLGSHTGGNENSINFASWNWLASNTTASNTDGSITSTVSANTTSGFSIVSYTGNATAGATIGHGLGVAPKVVIYKNRTDISDWSVYTEMVGNDKKLNLNLTSASTTSAHYNSTTPTSSFFTVGSSNFTNGSSDDMIAYCFADVQGFSKFGSYTGNGSTDGTFVYTGFKPAFVIIKRTDDPSGREWFMLDNKRDAENPVDKNLYASSSVAETSSERCDFLSNGFKLTTSSGGSNASGANIIYMAFAEEPLVGDNPATAR